MTIGYILLWLVGVSVLSLLIRSLRGPRQPLGWIVVAVSLLAGMGAVSVVVGVDGAGLAGAVLWALFVLLPMALIRRMEHALKDEDFSRARRLSKWVTLLHPADGFPELRRLIKKYVSEPPASLDPARWLREHPPKNGLSRLVLGYAFRRLNRWHEFRTWIETGLDKVFLYSNPGLYVLYLEALGELGETGRLLEEFWRMQTSVLVDVGDFLPRVEVVVYAYLGQVERLQNVLAKHFSLWPPVKSQRWISLATQRQGMAETHLLPLLNVVHAETHAKVGGPDRPYVTWTFIVLNVAAFIAEALLGGTEESVVLYALGGLLPQAVFEEGEWWRIFTANFLHFGPLHLGMNLLALYALGPGVEKTLGRLRYACLYLLSGVLSMSTVTVLVYYRVLGDQFLVGASGAISGLIGATGGLFLKVWRRDRSPMALQRLKGVLFAVMLQTAFDLSTRHVSFTAHMAGAVAGFLLSLVLLRGDEG